MKITVLIEGVHGKTKSSNKAVTKALQPITSSVTLIQGKKNILVDTGNLGYVQQIVSKLQQEGLKPEQIDYVINTHRHFDHCSNNYLFENAVRISGNTMWYPDKKVEVYTSVEEIKIPDVRLIATPGHTPESISVFLSADKKYVIAGDAIEPSNIRNNEYQNHPEREQIIMSINKILDEGEIIIPGHGPSINAQKLRSEAQQWLKKN
jgi:glyoxylase-like metal-dependent hydrolase (beta-lactamase superfamily II)